MSKRIEWLDIARGYGLLLVVLGHALTTSIRVDSSIVYSIYRSIYFFHMPLMFFVSGYAFQISYEKYSRMPIKEYFNKKFTKLIVPYISYSFIVYLIFQIAHTNTFLSSKLVNAGFGKISVSRWLYDLIAGNNIYAQHLWYIYTLFILSILSFLAIKIFKSNYKYVILIFTFAIYLFWTYLVDLNIDIIWKTFFRGIWFAFGSTLPLKSINDFISQRKNVLITIIIGVAAIGLRYCEKVTLNIKALNKILDLPVIMIVVLLVILASKYSENFKFIDWIGKNSFGIYLFHQPFFGSGLGVVLYGIIGLPIFLCIIISVAMCLIVPICVMKILDIKQLRFLRKILLGS